MKKTRKELQPGDRVFVGIDLHKKKCMLLPEQQSWSYSAAVFQAAGKHFSEYWTDTKSIKLKQFMKLVILVSGCMII